MKFAVIAAGDGSRLASEGVSVPKPLAEVKGEKLIDRLIRIFMDNDAEEIVVICNDKTNRVFFELSHMLTDAPFVLTTVDTVFKEAEFADYVSHFKQAVEQGADGLMGVTSFVDDEKPLWVGTRDDMTISGFYDQNDAACRYISAGIYGLTPKALETLAHCVEAGESRMRNFQRALLTDGFRLTAYAFSKVFDIDHVSDLEKANQFLEP